MPRNDDGEYELVLGNRQLLSGFFLLVVLFGVFFTMGYFVGRHSTPSNINAATQSQQAPPPVSAGAPVAPTSGVPEPGKAAVVVAEEVTRPTSTQPVMPPPTASPVAKPESRPEAKPEPPKPVEAKPERPAPPATSGATSIVTPAAGDVYLQVSAPATAAAASVVDALKKKGISAVVAPGPDASTVRVLVGPLVPADIPGERAKLESAGFKPFVRKY